MEWKPIETAPRDGTVVDLWSVDGFRLIDFWWDDEDKTWCGLPEDEFTHWMELTEPPKDSE